MMHGLVKFSHQVIWGFNMSGNNVLDVIIVQHLEFAINALG